PEGHLLQLAVELPADGVEEAPRHEGILGVERVDQALGEGVVGALRRIDEEEAALGGPLHRAEEILLGLTILLEVDDPDDAPKKQLLDLDVQGAQLLLQVLVALLPRHAQPVEDALGLELVALPGVEVDEGAELRGAGIGDERARIVEADL